MLTFAYCLLVFGAVVFGAVAPAGAVVFTLWRRCFLATGLVAAEVVAGLALAVEVAAGLAVGAVCAGLAVGAELADLAEVACAAGFAGEVCAGFIASFFTVVTGAEVAFALLEPVAAEFWAKRPTARNARPRVNATFFMIFENDKFEKKCLCVVCAVKVRRSPPTQKCRTCEPGIGWVETGALAFWFFYRKKARPIK